MHFIRRIISSLELGKKEKMSFVFVIVAILSVVSAFAFRSIMSSLCGEIVDCMIFLPLLYFFIHGYGTIITNVFQLLTIILIQALLKTFVEVVLFPLSAFLIGKIKRYEKSLSEVTGQAVNVKVE